MFEGILKYIKRKLSSSNEISKIEYESGKGTANDLSGLMVNYIFEKGKKNISSFNDFSSIMKDMESDLKDDFKRNVRNARPVSNFTMLRRKAFENLGEAGAGHVNPGRRNPYNKSIMNGAISSFNIIVDENKSDNSISLNMSIKDDRVPKGDFDGLRSGFKPPSDILMSIVGLNVTSHKTSTDDDRFMMIPTSDSSYAHGIIQSNGEISYDTNDSGVPIVFKKSIKPVNIHHYNPQSKDRIVFWGVSGGRVILPNNVRATIQNFI